MFQEVKSVPRNQPGRVPHTTRCSLCGVVKCFAHLFRHPSTKINFPTQAKIGLEWATLGVYTANETPIRLGMRGAGGTRPNKYLRHLKNLAQLSCQINEREQHVEKP